MTQTMNFTAVYYANPVCVTAFVTPRSMVELPIYADGLSSEAEPGSPVTLCVGIYMSDRSIARICNFTNAMNAMKYAFLLKKDFNCPISKNAMALIKAEVKRAQARTLSDAKEGADIAPMELDLPASDLPVFRQYEAMKKKHPDAILLFRVGDFYEVFGEDAQCASDIIGLPVTKYTKDGEIVSLAGFPHHALDTYLPKLVRAGKRVAICEQLEEPKKKTKRTKRA